VTLGYPWVRESDESFECKLRIPGYDYDSAGGYHVGVAVQRYSDGWMVYRGGSGIGSHFDLQDAIEHAEQAVREDIVEKIERARAEAKRYVALGQQIGMDVK
jgi:hypothetical protein